jgi:molecular chaperone Hsp33
MSERQDAVTRAITDDGSFRVIVAETTSTVRGTIAAQKASGPTAVHFADLLTGTILIRETMAPTLRVQGIAKGARGRSTLVADSHPDGTSRGLVQLKEAGQGFEIGPGSLMQMMRTLPSGAIHQGIVDVGSAGSLNAALMTYLQESEQIASVVGIGTVKRDGEVVRAGGFLVQLLDGAERSAQMIMAERLDVFPSVEEMFSSADFGIEQLLGEILYGMPHAVLETSPLSYACRCSHERVVSALATLNRAEIEDMVRVGEILDINCDYCGTAYPVAPEHLRALLEES